MGTNLSTLLCGSNDDWGFKQRHLVFWKVKMHCPGWGHLICTKHNGNVLDMFGNSVTSMATNRINLGTHHVCLRFFLSLSRLRSFSILGTSISVHKYSVILIFKSCCFIFDFFGQFIHYFVNKSLCKKQSLGHDW